MSMKKIYSARDYMDAHLLRGLLEAAGISASVMGESLSTSIGLLPAGMATAPTVWVNQKDLDRALPIVQKFNDNAAKGLPPAADAPWKCPKCNETIEGQFTDCWNCQTSRPGINDAPADSDPTPTDPTIQTDLGCLRCGYNLRGLTPANRCPECGLPILRALMDALRDGMPAGADELEALLYRPFEAVARQVGVPAQALILLCHAWMREALPIDRVLAGESDYAAVDPSQFCHAIGRDALDYFADRDEARNGFKNWTIQSSDDIGRLLQALAEAGLLEWQGSPCGDAFRGICSVDEMLTPETD